MSRHLMQLLKKKMKFYEALSVTSLGGDVLMEKAVWNGSHKAREARIVQGYEFICRYADEHGYPPTIREIGQELGYTSTSGAYNLLRELEVRGFIRKKGNCPRAITILDGIHSDYGPAEPQKGPEESSKREPGNCQPVYGRKSAV